MIFAGKTKTKNINILITGVILLYGHNASASSGSVVISQVQTGSSSSSSQEYVSIYNNSEQPVDLTNWCVNYASASDATQTQLGCIKPPDLHTKLMLPSYASVVLASNEFLSAHPGYNADFIFTAGISATSGHIKLLNQDKSVIDKLGWGAAASPEGTSAPAPPAGKILQRLTEQNILKDSNNNIADFQPAELVLRQPGNLYEEDIPVDPAGPAPLINELMPDAEGADAGKEFIEFYNPNETPVNLKDYIIQVGPSYAKSYPLPAMTMEPGSYLALNDLQTGMVLPNTSASVRLVASGDIVSSSEAYDSLGEGVSWILINDAWELTYAPTPNAENILHETKNCPATQVRSDLTGSCTNAAEEGNTITACKPDQERNLATNRCRKISVITSALLSCKAGQVRNPETGRCRSITAALTGASPCKPGQTRSPETKRCRNAAITHKKSCPAGQQINPKTNRCKKAAGSAAKLNNVKDVRTGLIANNAKWWVAGFATVGSAGYAIYEWRREAGLVLELIKDRIFAAGK